MVKYLSFIIFVVMPISVYADFNEIINDYHECSQQASKQVLSSTDENICINLQQLVILHFAKVDPNDYHIMLAKERAKVNRLGYSLYRKWKIDRLKNGNQKTERIK